MFRLRPKPKRFTPSELACCRIDLGGRTATEFSTSSGADPVEAATPNGDGTYTTVWTTPSGEFGFGQFSTTLCCSEILTINLGVGEDLGDFLSLGVGYVGGEDFDEKSYVPNISDQYVHIDFPEFFPVSVCGIYVRIEWGGETTVSITHGKA